MPVSKSAESMTEQITVAIHARWMYDKSLIIYDVSGDVDTDFTIISFYDHIDTVVRNWDAEKPFLALFHHYEMLPIWSPLQNQRLNQLKNIAKDHLRTGRAAVILPLSPVSLVVRMVLKTIRVGKLEIREFSSYDKALAWLEELLD